MPFKIQHGIVRGQTLPKHIGRAYGRHIFQLFHGRERKRRIWLRDLPSSIHDLDREYGITEPLQAYLAECGRTGQPKAF